MTEEEKEDLNYRISAKMSAKLSNLTSPANRTTPKSNRTIKFTNSDNPLEKVSSVAQVVVGHPKQDPNTKKSSSARPKPNSELQTAVATSSNNNSGIMRPGPVLLDTTKKNATITEENEEDYYDEESGTLYSESKQTSSMGASQQPPSKVVRAL